jgi:two-component system, cell cycle sensor histidine kinase and response regulator CckA
LTETEVKTILLCDDEPAIRSLVRKMLERRGFRVLEASDGLDAMELAKPYPGPIHVLLSDLVMPKLDGPSLAKRLLAIRPDVRVIFMTGYYTHVLDLEGYPIVQKPFTPGALLATVDGMLMAA